MATSLKHSFKLIATSWPADRLRPALQFKGAIDSATDRIFASPTPLSPAQLAKAEAAIQSLTNLMDDKAAKAYPITDKTMKPTSFPKHYTLLAEGIDKVSRGQGIKRGMFDWIRWK